MKNNRADIHYRIARFEQKRSNRGGIHYRMARFEQYNLHPGRNRHYQSGRQRDPWHIRERMVMVPVPTDHVDIDVQFNIYDTVEKKHSSYYTYRFASSFKDIDDLMAECDPDSRFLPRSPRLNHCHMSKRGETIRYSCNALDTNIRQIRTSSSPYGTASSRQLITNSKLINITRDDSGLPF